MRKSLFFYPFLIALLFVPFLNLNVYATTANFGYTTWGSDYFDYSANCMVGSVFTAPSDVDVANSITFLLRSPTGTQNVKAILVKHSDLTIVAIGNAVSVTTTKQLYTSTFASPPSLIPNEAYVLMVIPQTYDIRFYFDAGDALQGHRDYSNNYATPTNPTDAVHEAKKFTVYCTYTIAEGGETFKLSASTNLIFSLNSLPKFYGTYFVSSSIDVKFNVYPIVNRFGTFNLYPSINMRFDLSSRIQQYLGNVYNIFSSTNLIFHSSSSNKFFGFYHISPSININFNIKSITQISGVIHHILPSITLTFDISKTQEFWGTYIINPKITIKFNLPTSLSGGIIKGYEINDAILLAVLAFIISVMAIVLAVALRH